jgi:hypothetical protein
MKKYIAIAIIAALFTGNKVSSQTNDSTLNRLLNIDSALFVSKPLDSIIAILPSGYIQMRVVGIRNTARNLRIMYSNRVWIDLHIRQFNYMDPVDVNRAWNVPLMRKEILYKISVYKGVHCYTGCLTY